MSQEKIEQLRLIESQLSAIVSQKQLLQKQLLEVESALSELKDHETAYEIAGAIMIKKSASDLQSSLTEKKELVSKRIETFETQEQQLRNQAKILQEEVVANFKGESDGK